ncbi:50S ribosomal protein L21 [Candidatus Kuenenbacteria bacterium HGW-Kuenenbacteria-1]|uniref:Large ribosomal subunit protein bL21 n=1 Tax=Candidatus Kuenenbacteria bacterium HGW-Kuenenbacteria-1 TaxID=2013812 RepID=A0A2N1UN25_9BACT|nr:MAG: 50S ribosomal protein L21 [Candidatus Kuenenbacteria bacterium HGW-Kuenenbacteria-1]
MSIAIIKTGGKQYKIKKDAVLKIEKIEGNIGDQIEFDKVFLISDDKAENVQIGQPFLDTKIKAEILEQGKAKKVIVIKYKAKTRERTKNGHRQLYTKVKIKEIGK